MKSRRDQVQAHAYVVGRLTSALVHGEPDAPDSPMRRTALGSFGGVMFGTLAVAAFLIWGLISPASNAAVFKAGELVVVKQTESRYIFARGELHPVLNWSSAMLLLNGNSTITSVPAAALGRVTQGRPIGIPGAPDDLPAATAVNTGSWLVCSQSSGGRPVVSLAIGERAAVAQVPPGYAVIVQCFWRQPVPDLWRAPHEAGRTVDRGSARPGPGAGDQRRTAWLNAVPAAADLRPLPVADRGAPGPVLGGRSTRVGQVLADSNIGSVSQFYLVVAGGVTPISATQAAVLITDPATIAAYRGATATPEPVSPGSHLDRPRRQRNLARRGRRSARSAHRLRGHPAPGAVHAVRRLRREPALAGVRGAPAGRAPAAVGLTNVTVSPQSAGLIEVAPGGGALVRPQAAPGVSADSLFLVTDEGAKFPIPSAAAATALGYQARRAARMPAALLGLLPTGPALDLAPLRT